MTVYGHPTVALAPGARVDEIDALGQLPSTRPPASAPNGFTLVERRRVQQLWLWRYRRPQPATFTRQLLASGGAPVVLETSQPAERWLRQYTAQIASWQSLVAQIKAAGGSLPGRTRTQLSLSAIVAPRFANPPAELPWTMTLYYRLAEIARSAGQLAGAGPADLQPRLATFEGLLARLARP
jgi:hypothetical protein